MTVVRRARGLESWNRRRAYAARRAVERRAAVGARSYRTRHMTGVLSSPGTRWRCDLARCRHGGLQRLLQSLIDLGAEQLARRRRGVDGWWPGRANDRWGRCQASPLEA